MVVVEALAVEWPLVAAWLGSPNKLTASTVLPMAAAVSDLFLIGDTDGSLHVITGMCGTQIPQHSDLTNGRPA
jgi:hypothetical protein